MAIDWAIFATLSAALFGMVSILDKFVVERIVRDVRIYYLIFGHVGVARGAVILLLVPLEMSISLGAVGLAVLSGLAQSTALMLLWKILRTEEVSRAVPVSQISPVFVALIAAVFFSEWMEFLDWLAVIVVVSGAVLVSIRWDTGGKIALGRSFLLLLVVSFLIAISQVLSKQALEHGLNLWNMTGIFSLSTAGGFLVASLRRSVFQETVSTLKNNPSAVIWIAAVTILVTLALVVYFEAFGRGPVSLVATLMGTRPFFVFMYVLILSRMVPGFLHESFSFRTVLLKLLAIGMIVGGGAHIMLF